MQFTKEEIVPLKTEAEEILKTSKRKTITKDETLALFDRMLRLVRKLDRVVQSKYGTRKA